MLFKLNLKKIFNKTTQRTVGFENKIKWIYTIS